MVYRKGKGKTYYTRVGRRVVSCSTPMKSVALAMEAWAASIAARHDLRGVLAAVIDKRLTLVEAYKLGEEGAAQRLADRVTAAQDIDVRPQLAAFVTWRGQRTKGQSVVEKYQSQLERLYPEATWPRSTFTAPEFTRRLDALRGVSDPTRNRYRAALGAFCKYLVRVGVLPHNPARDVDAYGEHDPQVMWYEDATAKAIVAAVPPAFRTREALMAGAGLDWSDCARLAREDVDLAARTVRCHGSKTRHRNRVVRITEAWVLPILRATLANRLPQAMVCEPVAPEAALREHKAACRAARAAETTLHQWRHHYAVTLLKRGEKPQVVAHQLGHGNTKLVLDRYGKFVPDSSDYLPESESLAPNPATTTHRGTA